MSADAKQNKNREEPLILFERVLSEPWPHGMDIFMIPSIIKALDAKMIKK